MFSDNTVHPKVVVGCPGKEDSERECVGCDTRERIVVGTAALSGAWSSSQWSE